MAGFPTPEFDSVVLSSNGDTITGVGTLTNQIASGPALAVEIAARTTLAGTVTSQAGSLTANTTAISNEVTRATTAEGSIGGSITSVAGSLTTETAARTSLAGTVASQGTSISTNATAISAETTRATGVESTLTGSLAAASSVASAALPKAGGTLTGALTFGAGVPLVLADGSSITKLGTNLSTTSGTLNAAGGGGGVAAPSGAPPLLAYNGTSLVASTALSSTSLTTGINYSRSGASTDSIIAMRALAAREADALSVVDVQHNSAYGTVGKFLSVADAVSAGSPSGYTIDARAIIQAGIVYATQAGRALRLIAGIYLLNSLAPTSATQTNEVFWPAGAGKNPNKPSLFIPDATWNPNQNPVRIIGEGMTNTQIVGAFDGDMVINYNATNTTKPRDVRFDKVQIGKAGTHAFIDLGSLPTTYPDIVAAPAGSTPYQWQAYYNGDPNAASAFPTAQSAGHLWTGNIFNLGVDDFTLNEVMTLNTGPSGRTVTGFGDNWRILFSRFWCPANMTGSAGVRWNGGFGLEIAYCDGCSGDDLYQAVPVLNYPFNISANRSCDRFIVHHCSGTSLHARGGILGLNVENKFQASPVAIGPAGLTANTNSIVLPISGGNLLTSSGTSAGVTTAQVLASNPGTSSAVFAFLNAGGGVFPILNGSVVNGSASSITGSNITIVFVPPSGSTYAVVTTEPGSASGLGIQFTTSPLQPGTNYITNSGFETCFFRSQSKGILIQNVDSTQPIDGFIINVHVDLRLSQSPNNASPTGGSGTLDPSSAGLVINSSPYAPISGGGTSMYINGLFVYGAYGQAMNTSGLINELTLINSKFMPSVTKTLPNVDIGGVITGRIENNTIYNSWASGAVTANAYNLNLGDQDGIDTIGQASANSTHDISILNNTLIGCPDGGAFIGMVYGSGFRLSGNKYFPANTALSGGNPASTAVPVTWGVHITDTITIDGENYVHCGAAPQGTGSATLNVGTQNVFSGTAGASLSPSGGSLPASATFQTLTVNNPGAITQTYLERNASNAFKMNWGSLNSGSLTAEHVWQNSGAGVWSWTAGSNAGTGTLQPIMSVSSDGTTGVLTLSAASIKTSLGVGLVQSLASGLGTLALGTAGQVLSVNPAGGALVFETLLPASAALLGSTSTGIGVAVAVGPSLSLSSGTLGIAASVALASGGSTQTLTGTIHQVNTAGTGTLDIGALAGGGVGNLQVTQTGINSTSNNVTLGAATIAGIVVSSNGTTAALALAPYVNAGFLSTGAGGVLAAGTFGAGLVSSGGTLTALSGATGVDARIYGVSFDGLKLADVTTTASSATITSASYSFVSGDVGKYITIAGAGASGAVLNTRITSVSAGSALLTTSPSVSISGTGAATFGTDNATAMNAAAAAAGLLGVSAKVILPPGIGVITSSITVPLAQVSFQGHGAGKSVLKWISTGNMTTAMFQGLSGSTSAPYTDNQFLDFECDLEAAVQGTYNVAGKAFYLQYMLRPVFRGLYVHGAPATGIGVDYVVDGIFEQNIIVGCGRFNGGTNLGGAGIGIAIGSAFPREMSTVIGNYLEGNATYGVFFEAQTTTTTNASWARVEGNYVYASTAGAHGIGDDGLSRFICVGNHVQGLIGTSVGDGITAHTGTIFGSPGIDGLIEGNHVHAMNNGISVLYNSVAPSLAGDSYVIVGNKVSGSNNFGINIQSGASYVITSLDIKTNRVAGSTAAGIYLGGAAGFQDLQIVGNTLENNAATTGTAAYKAGVTIAGPITRLRMFANSIYDNRGTQLQAYALIVSTVAVTGATITGNDFSNNLTGDVALLTGGTISYANGSATTFLPTVAPTTLGDWTVAYGAQSARVIRTVDPNGVIVTHYKFTVTFTPTFTTASGILQFQVPFAGANDGLYGSLTPNQPWTPGTAFSSAGTEAIWSIIPNTTNMTLIFFKASAAFQSLNVSSLTSGTAYTFSGSGSYMSK